jgi:LacI family transcriptional regulator
MARPRRKKRVTLMGSLFGERHYDLCRSVYDYGQTVGNWQLVGTKEPTFSMPPEWEKLKLDGIIGIFVEKDSQREAIRLGIPAVNVASSAHSSSLPCVTHDDHAIGRMGAEHLLGQGATDFAFFGDSAQLSSTQQEEGFGSEIEQAGRVCHVRDGNGLEKSEAIKRWLAELPKPIAIMTGNDYMARQTINIAVEQGLRVPDDVAVLGVSNYRWAVLMSEVAPSSIELSWYRIGQIAAQTLEGLMDGGAPPPPCYIPPLRVVQRRSTEIVASDDPLVAHALQYIRDHLSHGIDAEDLLDQLEVSRRTLDNRMKAATGQSLYTAICRLRVEQAKQMLVKTDATMERIARECGLDRQSRLNELFKRQTGMTPGQFRQQRSR